MENRLLVISVFIISTNITLLFISKYVPYIYALQVFINILSLPSIIYLVLHIFLHTTFYKSDAKSLSIKNDIVKCSGENICTVWCGGRIGGLSINGPLLKFTLYPIGFQIKPIMMQEFSLLYSEILEIESSKFLKTSKVKISHAYKDIATPLIIYLPDNSNIILKLKELI